jgi:hypothetical protein
MHQDEQRQRAGDREDILLAELRIIVPSPPDRTVAAQGVEPLRITSEEARESACASKNPPRHPPHAFERHMIWPS